jgi:hypothetical protein
MRNVVFKSGNNIQVFRYGTTSNNKIEADKKRKIVQTYTFSRSQYEKILANVKGMKPFFNSADSNCLDCPFNSFGKCYTHKFNQFVGFVSMLKSIAKKYGEFDNIPSYNEQMRGEIVDLSRNTYVRFGTYGEPSEHPTELIQLMAEVASNWTGYTHQWHMKRELSDYFMASVHNIHQEKRAATLGFRSFIASDDKIKGIVNCPASKEAGNKSTCSKCGLCSGTKGKGNKSIYILTH